MSVLGRPNAGKSTLVNALVGEKVAIVASRPQTTRTSLQGVLTLPEAQIVFVDTPGIHKSTTLLNRRMMDTIRSSSDSDLIVFVVDALAPFGEEDLHALDTLKKATAPSILALNKVDQVRPKGKLLEIISRYNDLHSFAEIVPISALTGEGLDALRGAIIERLPAGPALYPEDRLTDQPARFMAGELIREQVLHLTRDEVPHSVAVLVDSWRESDKLIEIDATIYVERRGQKTILIGAGGSLLKKIGTRARVELERILGKKVFLSTFVKVQPDWRESPEFLDTIDWRSMSGETSAEVE